MASCTAARPGLQTRLRRDRPAATVIDDSPAVYLKREPTDEEHALVEAIGLHDGASTPAHMLAKVALRSQRHSEWQARLDGFLARARRYVVAAVVAAATNLAGVGLYWLHAHDTRVAEGERAAAQASSFDEYRRVTDKEIAELRLDIRELRRELRRLGLGGGPPDSSMWQVPDKLSSILEKGTRPCSLPDLVTLSAPLL